MLVTVAVTTVIWVTVTFSTQPESPAILESFYKRVRPGGPGWETISTRLGYGREAILGGALAWTNWIAGVIAVYATLFGIGKVIFGELGLGSGLLPLAVVSFAWIARSFTRRVVGWTRLPDLRPRLSRSRRIELAGRLGGPSPEGQPA